MVLLICIMVFYYTLLLAIGVICVRSYLWEKRGKEIAARSSRSSQRKVLKAVQERERNYGRY